MTMYGPAVEEGESGVAEAEAFYLPEEGEGDPRMIAARLVADEQMFHHLRHGDAVIMFLMRRETKVKNQRTILGQIALPNFQGGLADIARWLLAASTGGTLPDFIMVLDAEFWSTASPQQREALVFHELMHADQARDKEGEPRFTAEGMPVWGIRGHDIEEFQEVVRRYGAWLPDVQAFVDAAAAGGVKPT